MKSYIKYFSLFVVFTILMIGLLIRLYDYDKQQLAAVFNQGKYMMHDEFTLSLNNSLVKDKSEIKLEEIIMMIELHKSQYLMINQQEQEVSLKNSFIDMSIKYDLKDSLVLKSATLNLPNLSYCEN